MGSCSSHTFHATAVRSVVDRECSRSPESAAYTFTVLQWMKSGVYPSWHLDSIVQLARGTFDTYDAWCMARIDELMLTGRLAVVAVPVHSSPTVDRDIIENRRRLAAIERPFRATFFGGHGDEDGFLEWVGKAEFEITRGDEPEIVRLSRRGSIPLEVGTTSASRSLLHIKQDRGLARWPYGHDFCYVYALIR